MMRPLTFLCALLLAPGASGPPIDLLALQDAPLGNGLPSGWAIRKVRDQRPPTFAIDTADGAPVLRVSGEGQAAFAYRTVPDDLDLGAGVLRWSWRVLVAPAGADLRHKKRDDSALRVYVVFGKPGGLFGGNGRVIFYTWGNEEADLADRPSFASGRMHVVRVQRAADADSAWREHEVRPLDDFRKFWPTTKPPRITAIGVMQDTDDTRSAAVAELRSLQWIDEAMLLQTARADVRRPGAPDAR